jgi:hypothetical protein
MKKLVLFILAFSLIIPTSDYGMRNISKAVPKTSVVKRDFSTKAWQGSSIWNKVKYYPALWRSKLFNREVIPSADIKIEKASISATQGDKKTVINLSDPEQSSEWARKVISIWKPVKGAFRKFYESRPWPRSREQKGGSYWQYILGSAVVAYLTDLFSAQQEPSKKSEVTFDYSLDGELAQTTSPKDFVALLHKHGLTVADAVEYQCKKKEEEVYKELTKVAELTERDWRILQNIFELKKEFFQGHYKESNITFKGEFDPQVVSMVKSVLQKADIPYKVTVVRKDTATIRFDDTGPTAVAFEIPSNLKFSVNEDNVALISIESINRELYLSDDLLRSNHPIKLAFFAHESIHLSNMHGLEKVLFRYFLEDIKLFDEYKIEDCTELLATIHEYQADILILSVPEYAEAQSFESALNKHTILPDIYVPAAKVYTLASRAIALHKAEAELLANNRTGDKK